MEYHKIHYCICSWLSVIWSCCISEYQMSYPECPKVLMTLLIGKVILITPPPPTHIYLLTIDMRVALCHACISFVKVQSTETGSCFTPCRCSRESYQILTWPIFLCLFLDCGCYHQTILLKKISILQKIAFSSSTKNLVISMVWYMHVHVLRDTWTNNSSCIRIKCLLYFQMTKM